MNEAHPQPDIALNPQENTITFQLVSKQPLQRYKGTYSYDNLPIEFRVLFENIEEFYAFLTDCHEERIKIQDGKLLILAHIVGKMKEFVLPLTQMELTPEEQLRKEVWQLQQDLQQKHEQVETLQKELSTKYNFIEEMRELVEGMKELLKQKDAEYKQKDTEYRKLLGHCRQLQNRAEDPSYLAEEEKGGNQENPLGESRMTEEFTPPKKSSAATYRSRKMKELQEFGKKFTFKVDDSAKYYLKFKIYNNEVQKLHGPTYQLYNSQPLPRQGRFFFDVRIILIKNNNIVVGVITEKSKDEQFSFKKMNCLCYNGYDGSICEQDKQQYVNIKPKEGNKIRTVVDLTLNKIEWSIIGGQLHKNPIGSVTIPPSMAKQQLFPYFELYWEGNKVKLNT